jgi:hypothetical protein
MAEKKNPNDDYIDPVSPLQAAPLPPTIDEELLNEQRDPIQRPGGLANVLGGDEDDGDDEAKSKDDEESKSKSSARSSGSTGPAKK